MPTPFSFSGLSFATWDSSSGIEGLPPFANKPDACRLSVAENCRFTRNGGVMNRNGFEEKADLGTSAKIDDIITLPTLNIMFCKSGTKIEQSSDGITWYDVGLTRTAAAREFLFPHEKDVFATNGTDAYTRIACSKVTTTFTHTDVEITVDDITQFAASGTVYIEGDAITYSGITGSKLTGVSGIVNGGHAAGSVITQTSAPSGAPKATCIAELEGSALAAVGPVIYASLPSTDQNPEYFYDFNLTNGATAKRMSSDVTAMKSGLGGVLIGLKNGLEVATGFQLDSGALLTRSISKTHTIPNARCIYEGEREFFILTSEGRVLPVMNVDTGFQIVEDPNNPKNNLDFAVQRWIRDSKGAENSSNFIFYDSARRETSSCIQLNTGGTVEIILQRDIGAWARDTGKNMACKTLFNGRVYGGSDTDGTIYLMDEGLTDNGVPINFRICTGQMSVDKTRVTFDLLKFTLGGLLSANGTFTMRVYVDGALNYTESVTADATITKGLMSLTSGKPRGQGQIGAEQIGSAGGAVDAYSFTLPIEFLTECRMVQLEVECFNEVSAIEIRDFKLDCETENVQAYNPY